MKVLFVASYAGTSGANHSLIYLIKKLRDKGIEPIVLLPTKGKIEILLKKNKIPYKRMRLFNWVKPIKINYSVKEKIKIFFKKVINTLQEVRILFFIKRKKIDIVHLNAITTSWGASASVINKTPLVWHIREFLAEDLGKEFWNRAKAIKKISNADSIIAISKSVYSKYSNELPPSKMLQIYNGIEENQYSEIKNDIFNRDFVTLTITGRIVYEKGHEEVIYALNSLVNQGMKNIKLQIVGDEGDPSFIQKIKTLVNDWELNNHVFFLGYRNDMSNVWAETDIAIISSKAEAFGRVTVEAMMAGCLVLGANTQGTAELIGDKYGLLYEQGNYKSLADKVHYAANNSSQMINISKKAKKYAGSKFTADINAANILSVYNNLK